MKDQLRKNKLEFLFLARDKYPPFRVDIAVLFGKEFYQRGHTIDYLLQSEADCSQFTTENWNGSKVFVGPTNNGNHIFSRFHKYILSLLNDFRMLHLMKKKNYSFVQVKDKFIAALFAIFAARLSGTQFFFWLSYPFPESDIFEYQTGTARYPKLYFIRGIFLKFLLYRIILPLSNHVFVQSERMKDDVIKMGVPSYKITAVPMGVNLEDFSDQADDQIQTQPLDSKSIVYIGEMEKIRRIDFLLKVFKIVLQQFPDAKLYMIGGSSNPKDIGLLKKQAENLKIEGSITFTDQLPRMQALEYVKNATVCLSPIYPNPIYIPSSPTKIVEYMLMGKPVVANDIPEQLRILKESKAGLCVPYSKELFAQAIILLLSDPVCCKIMGAKGRQYVILNRSYRILAEALEHTYFELMNR